MPDPEDPKKGNQHIAAENPGEPSASEPEGGTAEAAGGDGPSLGEQLARALEERDELRQTLIRRQADFENFRKRLERERLEEGRRGIAKLLEHLLPVLDALERALAAHDDPSYEEFRKGFELIYRQLWDVLARQGLERIEADGKRFDPHLHHAIERIESAEHDDGTVVEVLQPGYLFHGRVLRAAIVRVAFHPGEATGEAATDAHKRVN